MMKNEREMTYKWIPCHLIAVSILFFIGSLPLFAQQVNVESTRTQTVETNASLWWARAQADINGNGRADLVVQDDNGHGGWLGWYETGSDAASWTRHIIADTGPGGGEFASGDLEVGDIDNDGDVDVLGLVHTGEWDSSGASTDIYWYENSSWTSHSIGTAPAFVKDIDVADFNDDGKKDLATVTDDGDTFSVFRQDSLTSWTKVHEFNIHNLHEGMDTGDIDGDGNIDVATNGYWVKSPGGDLTGNWPVSSIDDKWHSNQSIGWQDYATKVFCTDLTGNGRVDVFITHSEDDNADFPLSWYEFDPGSGSWTEHQIMTGYKYQHTLQVFDMDGDGDQDVVTGENGSQVSGSPTFSVFLNDGSNTGWTEQAIDENGVYNGLVADADGDGNQDIWRYPGHESNTYEVFLFSTNSGR